VPPNPSPSMKHTWLEESVKFAILSSSQLIQNLTQDFQADNSYLFVPRATLSSTRKQYDIV
jgi:hypothetical protein